MWLVHARALGADRLLGDLDDDLLALAHDLADGRGLGDARRLVVARFLAALSIAAPAPIAALPAIASLPTLALLGPRRCGRAVAGSFGSAAIARAAGSTDARVAPRAQDALGADIARVAGASAPASATASGAISSARGGLDRFGHLHTGQRLVGRGLPNNDEVVVGELRGGLERLGRQLPRILVRFDARPENDVRSSASSPEKMTSPGGSARTSSAVGSSIGSSLPGSKPGGAGSLGLEERVGCRSRRAILVGLRAHAAPVTGEVRFEIIGPDQVFDVEECRALEPDVDERRLHPRENAAHLAEIDVPERALRGLSLDVELGDDPVFDERDACLSDVDVDDEKVLGHVPGSARGRRSTVFGGPPRGGAGVRVPGFASR